ncbi:unnamed protein product [Darwinula stevensoni]|uniref:Trafficking protein particle complex subunit 9 n=1 Tax=Darwinula stevensoni TaxID=69355 RepID=A0A7R8X2M5_9CRUS|nr:unnamed protein product [Darwinula stevensoni]CAG0883588.1 unnamed protein product [Darwinula stevensoni]
MRSSVSVILSSPPPDTTMHFPDYGQTVKDHQALLILVRHSGQQLKGKTFNRLFDRISKVNQVKITDQQGWVRNIRFRYKKVYPVENNDWGDFQSHRRLLGLISLGKCTNQGELNEICRQHESLKTRYNVTLYDSRCIIFGVREDGTICSSPEPGRATSAADDHIVNGQSANEAKSSSSHGDFRTTPLFYPCVDSCDRLESDIIDFVSSLFWVLESKRMEKGLERLEKVPLLCAPFEKKDFVGIDLDSRSNRKRCIGRAKKHLADLSLQAGLPGESIPLYIAAVDILRPVNDWFWLGCALEGLATTSAILLYPNVGRTQVVQRNSSLNVGDSCRPKVPGGSHSLPNGLDPSEVKNAAANCLSPEDIIDKYREAIIHYSKYRHAGIVEAEASIKATHILIEQDKPLLAADFLQNVVFINLNLPDEEKIQRFVTLSELYSCIGFHRKAAFFRRVAAMRCVAPQNPKTDWNQCYHLLLLALEGYKLSLDPVLFPGSSSSSGWAVLQICLLEELIACARRMGNVTLATQHLAFLLTSMMKHLSLNERRDYALQLEGLAVSSDSSLSIPLALDNGFIVPPVHLTQLPELRSFMPLAPPLSTRPVRLKGPKRSQSDSPFIFSPFQTYNNKDARASPSDMEKGDTGTLDFNWVVGDICHVALNVFNPLPIDLKVSSISLLTSGVKFQSESCSVTVAPLSPDVILLSGTPQDSGDLKLLGYTTQLLGMKSTCRLRALGISGYDIKIIPPLPTLSLSYNMNQNWKEGKQMDALPVPSSSPIPSSEPPPIRLSLFAGESRTVELELKNESVDCEVCLMDVTLESSLEDEGYEEGEVFSWEKDVIQAQLPIQPSSHLTFTLTITAPHCPSLSNHPLMETGSMGSSQGLSHSLQTPFQSQSLRGGIILGNFLPKRSDSSVSMKSSSGSRHSSLGPIGTGTAASLNKSLHAKVLGGVLWVKYSGGKGIKKEYARRLGIPMSVEVKPSLCITHCDVLPALLEEQCYLVADILNQTPHEMEVKYAEGKEIVLEAMDACRVPIPIKRSPLIPPTFPKLGDTEEMERIRKDVLKQVDLKWRIPSVEVRGSANACLTSLPLSPRMLDLLHVPPIKWQVRVNGRETEGDEVGCGPGEILEMSVTLVNLCPMPLPRLLLRIQVFQDLENGNHNYNLERRIAIIGSDRTLLSAIGEHAEYEHRFGLLLLTPGSYKVDLYCIAYEGDGSLSQDSPLHMTVGGGNPYENLPMVKNLPSSECIWRHSPPLTISVT